MQWSRVLVVLLAVAMAACSRAKAKTETHGAPVAAKAKPDAAPTLEPLIEWKGVDELPVKDWGDAVAWVPVGATSPQPIVLGVHGNNETPEVFCAMLHEIVGSRAFILCPRGVRPAERSYPNYVFASPQTLTMEVESALTSLERRYPGYVDRSALLYVGFSRGAFLSVAILATEPARYPRAILIEGGQDAWTPDRIKMFGAEGGKRILFACGQPDCLAESARVAVKLDQVGVETRTAFREGAGHAYNGAVFEDLRKGFEWVIEGDPRWHKNTL